MSTAAGDTDPGIPPDKAIEEVCEAAESENKQVRNQTSS